MPLRTFPGMEKKVKLRPLAIHIFVEYSPPQLNKSREARLKHACYKTLSAWQIVAKNFHGWLFHNQPVIFPFLRSTNKITGLWNLNI